MKPLLIQPISYLKGEVSFPGDKSIAHRALILSAISQGKTRIKNFPASDDCIFTLNAFKKLGIKLLIKSQVRTITVYGRGLLGLRETKVPIFVGDSGTTLRLLLGVLAGYNFKVKLTAGRSLSHRPMRRVNAPLRMMGAKISTKGLSVRQAGKIQNAKIREEYPPITIEGGVLKPITYRLPVASAQVKSAILLAGLYARGITKVIEPIKTRDHTERLLKFFKARIKLNGNTIVIEGGKELVSPGDIYIPGDLSSASFFMVLATILSQAKVKIKNVNLNRSRIGIIRILKRMGADLKVFRRQAQSRDFEPIGDIVVKNSRLKGIRVEGREVPSLIDELPILMVAACCAQGKSIFEGVGELRIKETDRITAMVDNLRQMGARISAFKSAKSECIAIEGGKRLKGCLVKSFGDHRIAMSMVIAGLKAEGSTRIDDLSCINKSFPTFFKVLNKLIK